MSFKEFNNYNGIYFPGIGILVTKYLKVKNSIKYDHMNSLIGIYGSVTADNNL